MAQRESLTPHTAQRLLTRNELFSWLLIGYVALQLGTLVLGLLAVPLVGVLALLGGVLGLLVLIVAILVHVQNHRAHLPTQASWLIYLARVILIVAAWVPSRGSGQLVASALAWVAEIALILAAIFAHLALPRVRAVLRP